MEKIIPWNFVYKGASTLVLSISYWKSLGSPSITPSPTILIGFDGRSFFPYGIFTALPITLGGKTVIFKIEVIDRPLECNLLLVRNWTYAMKAFPSIVFCIIWFPHEVNIITVYQLDFYTFYLWPITYSNVPLICDSFIKYETVEVGFFQRLILDGHFPFTTPRPTTNGSYQYDLNKDFLWPMDTTPSQQDRVIWNCHAINTNWNILWCNSITITFCWSYSQSLSKHKTWLIFPTQLGNHLLSFTCIPQWCPTFRWSHLEVMALIERTWEDIHHRSSFLLDQERVDKQIHILTSIHIVDTPLVPPN